MLPEVTANAELVIPALRLDVALFGLTCDPGDAAAVALGTFVPRWLADALTPEVAAAAVLLRSRNHAAPRTADPDDGDRRRVRDATRARTLVSGSVAAGDLALDLDEGRRRRRLCEVPLEPGHRAHGVAAALEAVLDHFCPKGAAPGRADLARLRALADDALADLVALAEDPGPDPVALARRVAAGAPALALTVALCGRVVRSRRARGDLAGSLAVARALAEARPDDGHAQAALAQALEASGDAAAAAETLALAARLDPAAAPPLTVGRAFAAAGDAPEAARWFVRGGGAARPAAAADNLVALAELHAAAGRPGEAEARLREALTRVPDHAWAHADLGALLGAKGDLGGMVKALEAGLGGLPPDDRDRLVDAASDRLLAAGDVGGLLAVAAAATADGHSSPVTAGAYAVGVLRTRGGDLRRALVLLRPHLGADLPGEIAGPLKSLFADVACRLADAAPDPEARAVLHRAVEVAPDHGDARLRLGRLLLAAGRSGEALTVLQPAPGLPGGGERAWAELARAHLAEGREDLAAVAAERAGKAAKAYPELRRLGR